MATETSTQGVTITVANSSGTPVTITGHSAITGIGSGSSKEIDKTTMASTAKEFRQGLRDFGKFKIMFKIRDNDDAGQAELFNMQAVQATRVFVVTLPRGTLDVCTLSGYVESMTSDLSEDSIYQGECTVRITGAPVWS